MGVNQSSSREGIKRDAALLVGGSVEARGGVKIKKVANTTLGNNAINQKLEILQNYTSLDLDIQNGKVYFEGEKKNDRAKEEDVDIVFSHAFANKKVNMGINTANPSAALAIGQGGDLEFIAGTAHPNDAGDVVFKKANGAQNARIWSRNDGA